MPPRKLRPSIEERALRSEQRMGLGSVSGRVESASPVRGGRGGAGGARVPVTDISTLFTTYRRNWGTITGGVNDQIYWADFASSYDGNEYVLDTSDQSMPLALHQGPHGVTIRVITSGSTSGYWVLTFTFDNTGFSQVGNILRAGSVTDDTMCMVGFAQTGQPLHMEIFTDVDRAFDLKIHVVRLA